MAWGANSSGKLGNGTTIDHASPVPVPNLRDVVAISAGGDHSLALKTDGSVWAWGENSSGQLGDQTLIPKFTPVQVEMPEQLMFSSVVAIAAGGAHSLALEQNGQVWAWGGNAFGQLGDGFTIDTWLPVMPRFMQEVTAIAAGFGHSLVVRRDRTVRAWGANSSGQLGDNTTMDRHISVQVMGLPEVTSIAAGTHHSLAILT
jgi:alpha-tubulin suppressor-like RCC1 family protein